MKLLIFLGLCLGLAAAGEADLNFRPNYSGYRVLRMNHTADLRRIIEDQSLATWEASQYTGEIDVVVPPGLTVLDDLTNHVMHHDLGRSVEREANFDEYGTTIPSPRDTPLLTNPL